MKIMDREISLKKKPFIIAELSGNHNQSIDRALSLVDEAVRAGVDAIKLQTYTAETMTFDQSSEEFVINDEKSLWYGQRMYDLYKKAYTPWEWHKEIFEYAKSFGLIAFSSPFDNTAVDFLESLDVPAYKIASFECVDLELIKKVAATKKPVIMSTGMATISEIDAAVSILRTSGCDNFALLKCTSTYPAIPNNTNLNTIRSMREVFDCEVGLSDHTMGIGVACAAIGSNASLIEKHFTLDRNDGGVDSTFSLEPKELEQLVVETNRAWQAIGTIKYGATEAEENARKRRRSLYYKNDLSVGDVLTENDLKRVRPGYGLEPKFQQFITGMVVKRKIVKGQPVAWDDFK